jgi:hypothetical protein
LLISKILVDKRRKTAELEAPWSDAFLLMLFLLEAIGECTGSFGDELYVRGSAQACHI